MFQHNDFSSIYILFSDENLNNLGQIIASIVSPNIVIKSVSKFESLSQNYAVEIKNIQSLGDYYISQSISELPFEKLSNHHRSSLISSLLNESEILRSQLEMSEEKLDQLESSHRSNIKGIQELLKNKELELKNKKQEVSYSKERYNQMKSSFSYKFGNLIARSLKTPKGILLLPLKLSKFLFDSVKRKIKDNYKKKNELNSFLVHDSSIQVPVIDQNFLKLASYLSEGEVKQGWNAVITSNWLEARLENIAKVHTVLPNTWPEMFGITPPSRLVIDSLDMLENSSWLLSLEGSAFGYPNKLIQLLNYCSSHGIETIFWHSASPDRNRLASEICTLFSKVYISDIDELIYLKDIYGIDEQKIHYLPLGVDGSKFKLIDDDFDFRILRIVILDSEVSVFDINKIRTIYQSFMASIDVMADAKTCVIIGTLEDAEAGDLVMIPSYPKTKKYIPVEAFKVIEKACIPFTLKDSIVNDYFPDLIPILEDETSFIETLRVLVNEKTSRQESIALLREKSMESFDLSKQLQVIFESEQG